MTELENKIFDIVRKIPRGKVMTYGQVAAALGDSRLARVVGNTMHKNPVPFFELACETGFNCKERASASTVAADKAAGGKVFAPVADACIGFAPVPCHRVVNAAGKMGANFGLGGPSVQAKMLEREGVEVHGGKIDLKKYGMYGDSAND